MIRKCGYCGKKFRSNKKHMFYCSKICFKKFYIIYHQKYCKTHPKKRRYGDKKKCITCGGEFETGGHKGTKTYNQRKYCSKRCESKARENKIMLKCLGCGKEFKTIPALKNRKYCSKECNNKFGKHALLPMRKCIKCGEEFKPRHSYNKYCSRICAGVGIKALWIIIKCKTCGKEIRKRLSDKRKYCSRACYAKERSEMIKGRKNPIFKYGIPQCKSGGRRADLNNQYFRSSWEANYARYLNYMEIKWIYELKTFMFNNIKRGTRSYTPDFYIIEKDEYHEVKGYMRPRARTQLKRMAKYYPEIKIVLIDKKKYNEIKKRYINIIPNWEK